MTGRSVVSRPVVAPPAAARRTPIVVARVARTAIGPDRGAPVAAAIGGAASRPPVTDRIAGRRNGVQAQVSIPGVGTAQPRATGPPPGRSRGIGIGALTIASEMLIEASAPARMVGRGGPSEGPGDLDPTTGPVAQVAAIAAVSRASDLAATGRAPAGRPATRRTEPPASTVSGPPGGPTTQPAGIAAGRRSTEIPAARANDPSTAVLTARPGVVPTTVRGMVGRAEFPRVRGTAVPVPPIRAGATG